MNISKLPKGIETHWIPIDKVRLSGIFNRLEWGELTKLAEDIKANGQLEPITVSMVKHGEDEYFEIVHGERRFKAILIINEKLGGKITDILAKNAPKGKEGKALTEAERIFFNVSSNNRKDFTPLELGYKVKRLIELGINMNVIAEKFGKSVSSCRNYLELANASPAIRKKIEEKRIKPTTAHKLVKASKQVQEDTLLKSDLNPGVKIKGKDIDEAVKGSQIPEAPNASVPNYDTIIETFIAQGWMLKEKAVKENVIGRCNLEFTFRRFTPATITVLVR